MGLRLYGLLLIIFTPLLKILVHLRRLRHREDPRRYRERYGLASESRGEGTLIWFHAASVGEVISILPLLHDVARQRPDDRILLTTTTRSSADYIANANGPSTLIHQYAPLDHPLYVRRFMRHWRPQVGFFVESEIWPQLIQAARANGVVLGLINARLSPRSFSRWKKWPHLARQIIGAFDHVLAQDTDTAERLSALGLAHVEMLGNIKRGAPDLPYNADHLRALQTAIGDRPIWLAASTHDDEEALAMRVHHGLVERFPDLLTIIVPRHPDRVTDLMSHPDLGGRAACRYTHFLNDHGLSLRAHITDTQASDDPDMHARKDDGLGPHTHFLFGDTIGDMGVFYRLAPICLIGGTFIPHGGQNPLEAARLSCAILYGPSISNFREIFADLDTAAQCVTRANLAPTLAALLSNPQHCADLQHAAEHIIARDRGTRARIGEALLAIISAASPNQ